MPIDVFGNQNSFSGGKIVTANEMQMTIEGQNTLVGALVQQIAIQYAQPIQTVREIGSVDFRQFAQPPQGTVTFGRIVSEDRNILSILPDGTNEGNIDIWTVPCEGRSPTIRLLPTATECERVSSVGYILTDCIVENFGVSVDATGAFVQENVSLRFGSLHYPD